MDYLCWVSLLFEASLQGRHQQDTCCLPGVWNLQCKLIVQFWKKFHNQLFTLFSISSRNFCGAWPDPSETMKGMFPRHQRDSQWNLGMVLGKSWYYQFAPKLTVLTKTVNYTLTFKTYLCICILFLAWIALCGRHFFLRCPPSILLQPSSWHWSLKPQQPLSFCWSWHATEPRGCWSRDREVEWNGGCWIGMAMIDVSKIFRKFNSVVNMIKNIRSLEMGFSKQWFFVSYKSASVFWCFHS